VHGFELELLGVETEAKLDGQRHKDDADEADGDGLNP